jgi:hypothetical protein
MQVMRRAYGVPGVPYISKDVALFDDFACLERAEPIQVRVIMNLQARP